ncbi:MAG: 1-acyl-sn-glycerol-3-phosphate acyltransferase [Desulfobacterales bacterium]|jgi:1-acyl-sn-glycerol-3-phosphate acyltransferase|nr:1-acyl-sn-glycerol-3-phosphate acyltransferase [Desulfobacterales bacterium]
MMQTFSRSILKTFGWQAELAVQMVDKCVLVGAPHTTNWDFPLAILGMSAMGIKFNWVGKHTLFRWPWGFFMRLLGGIPLDRRSGGAGFAIKTVETFHDLDHFVLAIAPEGTRHKTDYWKAGFYKIATKSNVPIALGYVDFRKKKIGIGKIFMPTGDKVKDFALVRDFYSNKPGKYPEKQGEIRLR